MIRAAPGSEAVCLISIEKLIYQASMEGYDASMGAWLDPHRWYIWIFISVEWIHIYSPFIWIILSVLLLLLLIFSNEYVTGSIAGPPRQSDGTQDNLVIVAPPPPSTLCFKFIFMKRVRRFFFLCVSCCALIAMATTALKGTVIKAAHLKKKDVCLEFIAA